MNKLLGKISAAAIAFTMLLGGGSVLPEQNVEAASAAVVDLSKTYQTIRGFGGINHPEWTMDKGGDLNAAQRQTAFGNGDNELGLTVLRVFVNPDKNQWKNALPTAQFATNKGGITIFASPWEPPANLAESGGSNGKLHLPKSNYAAYAQHLNDFGTYMKNNGVDLYSVSVQNEPDFAKDWTYWSTDETTDFLANYADKITSTKVMSPESYQYSPENAFWISNGDGGKTFYKKILNNAKAFANCDVFGTHFYGTTRDWMDFPELENSGKEIWMTEVYVPNSDADSANRYPEAIQVAENIHNAMVVGNMSVYTWWTIRRSYGLMTDDGKISKRGYCMAQYSKYVRPGSVRVDVTEQPNKDVYVSAYKNGGKVTIVAVNKSSTEYTQQFSVKGKSISNVDRYRTSANENLAKTANLNYSGDGFYSQLPANSVSTFVVSLSGESVDPTDPTDEPVKPNEYGWYFHDEFEQSLCDWKVRGDSSKMKVQTSGRTAYKGTEALGIYDRDASWNGALKPLNPKAFEPGKEYSFSANITYFDGDDTDQFSLTLQYKDASGTTKYANIATGTVGKGQWAQLSNKNFKIPDGATDLELVIETSKTTNNFYIDEVIGAVGGTTILGAGEYKEPVVTTTTTVTTNTTTTKATTTQATTKATTTQDTTKATTTQATTKATTTQATTKATTTQDTTNAATTQATTTTMPIETKIPGDINNDGKVSVADIIEMQKYLIKAKTIIPEIFKQLDFNGDGKFNIFDFIAFKKLLLSPQK